MHLDSVLFTAVPLVIFHTNLNFAISSHNFVQREFKFRTLDISSMRACRNFEFFVPDGCFYASETEFGTTFFKRMSISLALSPLRIVTKMTRDDIRLYFRYKFRKKSD